MARERAQELMQRKGDRRGVAYAKQELEAVENIDGLTRWCIVTRIEKELQSIEGDETWSEIQDQVEDVFESEGIADDGLSDDVGSLLSTVRGGVL